MAANLVPLLAFFSVVLLAATVHSQDSIAFSVDTFTQNPTALTYQRDAHIPTDSTFLRLTQTRISDGRTVPERWSSGRVMFSTPVELSQSSTSRQASFETTIQFNIAQSGDGGPDGIAFFIAPVGSTVPWGGTGANLGIFNSPGTSDALFAVEFDTHTNPGDPDFPHIGIDINSRNSSATTRFENALGQTVTARINYDANTKTISVVANTEAQSYSLSYGIDLTTVLPDRVQVGVSGSTGESDELGFLDLLSWSFNSTLVNVNSN